MKLQAIRGMHDYLPVETALLEHIEKILKKILFSYGYNEISFPIVEKTSLFKKAIGSITDVVEKEMYIFKDRKGESLTLRPEGTASCVRAGIEHGFLYNKEQKFWYKGPMFRYERPQKGRYRQFNQIGVEVFGHKGPDIDAELIFMTHRWWRALCISDYVKLEINSIGSKSERARYRKVLVSFLKLNKHHLDETCLKRIDTNPLRILDSKNNNIKKLLNDAPLITDYLDENSKKHFDNLCKFLKLAGISYTINPKLVRGLDYYNRTVFEWVTKNIGSQGALCGGGRYDYLVEQLGGNATPAIGFAIGLDRLIMLIKTAYPNLNLNKKVDAYIIGTSNNIKNSTLFLAEKIRNYLPKLRLMTNYGEGSLKKQFNLAYKYGAKLALVIGENEIASNKVFVKDLCMGNKELISQNDVILKLKDFFKKYN